MAAKNHLPAHYGHQQADVFDLVGVHVEAVAIQHEKVATFARFEAGKVLFLEEQIRVRTCLGE